MPILIIDGDASSRSALTALVERGGYQALCAADHEDGRRLARQHQAQVVLIDWATCGADFVASLRAVGDSEYRYVIMLTAESDEDKYRASMLSGVDDYLTKPVDEPALLTRIQVAERITRLQHELASANRALHLANDRLEKNNWRLTRDIRTAARLQHALLPSNLPDLPAVEMAWSLEPCEPLAGDLVNIFALDPHHLGFYLFDVSGHGVSAALLAVQISRLLTPNGQYSGLLYHDRVPTDPGRVLAELNRDFQLCPPVYQFFTMVYGVLDHRSGALRYACGGHPAPVRIPAQGPVHTLAGGGHAIGVKTDDDFPTHRCDLEPGDRLVCYSDGLIEAVAADGRFFDQSGLVAALEAWRDAPIGDLLAQVQATVRSWSQPEVPQDDCSLVAVGRR